MATKDKPLTWTQQMILRKLGVAMASGGTMTAGNKLQSAMDKLGIQGQGLKSSLTHDGHGLSTDEESPSESRPTTATSGDPGDSVESFSMPPEAVNVLETVINMNKSLEQQIDTLRMRLTVESKQHNKDLNKISEEKEKLIEAKEGEIDELRDSLVNRDDRIGTLVKDSHEKDLNIHYKEREINDLKELVKQSENYADQLQKKISRLKGDKQKLELDPIQKEQNDEMKKLRYEISSLKEKVSTVETELTRAKLVIEQQDIKIKTMELEKGMLSDKFKAELEKAGRQMRTEVERMREVMKQQYEEMRNLRQQNSVISSDVRDIKDILLKGTIKPEPVVKQKAEKLDVNNFKSPRSVQKTPNHGMHAPLTARQPSSLTTRQSSNVNRNSQSVRSSMPGSLNQTSINGLHARGFSGLPPIAKEQQQQQSVGKWIPAGAKQSTIHVKTPRDRKK